MIYRLLIILLGVSGLLLGGLSAQPAQAQQTLPLSAWYAIVHQPETDTLHWLNVAGEQAVLPRPNLPDEAQYRGLRIAPNGRSMVIAAQLTNGLEALGIYDFAAGRFVQTHQAQPGEVISLGGGNIFSANSQYFAVGLFSGDFAAPAWRVIVFDSATGDAEAFIDHTHPDAPEVQLSAPEVQYLDGTSVHFQMVPQGVGAWHTWPAYAWRAFGFDPTLPLISESPYTGAGVQVQPLTGEVVQSYRDDSYAAAPMDGQTPDFNAVGVGVPANNTPFTTVHADGTRYHLATRWAKGGEWILFLTDDVQDNRYWSIVLADGVPGNNGHVPFDPSFISAHGTSDGYLLLNEARQLYHSDEFMPNTAQMIAQLSPAASVVYVTPLGVNFLLDQLPNGAVVATDITPTVPPAPVEQPTVITVEPVGDCSTVLPQRVGIGSGARVLLSVPNLNVRQTPYGEIVVTLASGDSFIVIGGPICEGDLYWWQIDYNGMIGWVAEATDSGYFIEPYDGAPPAEEPVTDTPEPPQPPPPPPVGDLDEEAAPEAEEESSGCGAPGFSVGEAAVVRRDVTPHNGPDGQALPYVIPNGSGVVIAGDMECVNGSRWFPVAATAYSLTDGTPLNSVFWISDGRRHIGRNLE